MIFYENIEKLNMAVSCNCDDQCYDTVCNNDCTNCDNYSLLFYCMNNLKLIHAIYFL